MVAYSHDRNFVKISYVSGTGGYTIPLSPDENMKDQSGVITSVDGGLNIRGHEWQYDAEGSVFSASFSTSREVQLTFATNSSEYYDYIRRICDLDVYQKTPGTLVWEFPNVSPSITYTQRCYVSKIEFDSIYRQQYTSVKMTIIMLDGKWSRYLGTTIVSPELQASVMSAESESDYLDFPYNYDYDYSPPYDIRTINIPRVGIYYPVIITISGPISKPEITIGGNKYSVDVNVPDGSNLVINGIDKTVTLTNELGVTENVFDKALRGDGEGSGEYIFHALSSGENDIVYSESFSFTVDVYAIDLEPPRSATVVELY